MKKLYMKFKNELDKPATLSLGNPKENLSELIVKREMQKIVDLNLFEKDGVNLYQAVDQAEVREIVVTKIF